LLGYECSDSWIRQEHAKLEADLVQNEGMRRDSYRNSKGRIEWTLVSRDQSLDWYQVVGEEIAICSWGLRKLHYDFSLHSLVLFLVFLE